VDEVRGVSQKWAAACWWRWADVREEAEWRCKWAAHGHESGTITF